jgi:phage gpG-like protein
MSAELNLTTAREFSLLGFAAHLGEVILGIPTAETKALTKSAKLVAEDAKAQFGHQQDAVGPFPGWEPLHDSTLHGGRSPRNGVWFEGKIPLGYATESEDNPLMREGTLRDSISYTVKRGEATVGSDCVYAGAQEFGDPGNNLAPRPFLGPAGFRNAEKIATLVGKAVVQRLTGTIEPD